MEVTPNDKDKHVTTYGMGLGWNEVAEYPRTITVWQLVRHFITLLIVGFGLGAFCLLAMLAVPA